MKKFITACLPILFILLCISLYACNKSKATPLSEEEQARAGAERMGIDIEKHPRALITSEDLKHGERTTVIGMLRMVGTGHFPQIVITPTANFDIHLKTERSKIPDYDETYNRYVEVTGIVSVETIQYGIIERKRYSMTVERIRRVQ